MLRSPTDLPRLTREKDTQVRGTGAQHLEQAAVTRLLRKADCCGGSSWARQWARNPASSSETISPLSLGAASSSSSSASASLPYSLVSLSAASSGLQRNERKCSSATVAAENLAARSVCTPHLDTGTINTVRVCRVLCGLT